MRLIRINEWWLETTQAIDFTGEPIDFHFYWLFFDHIDDIEGVRGSSRTFEEVRGSSRKFEEVITIEW
ncbi:Uncharacterised protein [Yersinia kristensenii]|nr:Uncharacterised protein [Yersinia kristensenii]